MTRRFAGPPVERPVLARLLDLARRAPTAGYSQGAHFLVYDGEALDEFWETTGAGNWFAATQPGVLDASAVVVPIGDPGEYTARYSEPDKAGHGLEDPANWPVPYWLTDTAMAAQNLLLLLEEAGIGALLFGIFANETALLEAAGAPPGAKAIGAIAVGYRAPADRPTGSATTRPRRPVGDVIHWGRW